MAMGSLSAAAADVAPARERGLKLVLAQRRIKLRRRSRKGAWIEMRPIIASYALALVAPTRECELKYRTWLDYRFC